MNSILNCGMVTDISVSSLRLHIASDLSFEQSVSRLPGSRLTLFRLQIYEMIKNVTPVEQQSPKELSLKYREDFCNKIMCILVLMHSITQYHY